MCAPGGRRSRVRHLAGELVGHRPARQPGRRRADLGGRAAIKAPILVGGVLAGRVHADNPVSTNSVIVWDPGTGPADRHDKQIVQPFGEYLPWRSFFKHLSPYAERAGHSCPAAAPVWCGRPVCRVRPVGILSPSLADRGQSIRGISRARQPRRSRTGRARQRGARSYRAG